MSDPELKPCPAGTEAMLEGYRSGYMEWTAHVAARSGWIGPELTGWPRSVVEARAARRWNTRAPSADWPSLRRLEREEVSDA